MNNTFTTTQNYWRVCQKKLNQVLREKAKVATLSGLKKYFLIKVTLNTYRYL